MRMLRMNTVKIVTAALHFGYAASDVVRDEPLPGGIDEARQHRPSTGGGEAVFRVAGPHAGGIGGGNEWPGRGPDFACGGSAGASVRVDAGTQSPSLQPGR